MVMNYERCCNEPWAVNEKSVEDEWTVDSGMFSSDEMTGLVALVASYHATAWIICHLCFECACIEAANPQRTFSLSHLRSRAVREAPSISPPPAPSHDSFVEKTMISSWMTAHHLKLNPSKTELLFIPSTTGPHRDLTISFGNSFITPTEDARSLGVILDGQLSFSAHIANLTRSCRFLLYNIRRIRPFLSQEATQLLVQSLVISRLDYCNSLLAGLPLRAIRPLQLAKCCSPFKTLMLAYKAKNGPAPPYLMVMVKSRAVPRALRASSTARLEPPSLRTHGRQASRLFSVLAPRWWNELPLGVRTAESLAVFKRRLKTHLFVKHL
ncbi:hypothetical protein NFI96_030942, partial [Prochilodus magdalenae]